MALQALPDTAIYWEQHGEGDPLILLSGYSASHAYWLPHLATLAKRFRVILLDNPGIGRTQDKGTPLTIRDMAHSLSQFMQDIGVPTAHVVGHSMGGMIAMTLAALHPHRVKRLALLNTTARIRPLSRHVLRNLLDLRLSQIPLHTLFESMVPWYFSNYAIRVGKRPAELADFFIRHQDDQSTSDQSRQLDALLAYDGSQWTPMIQSPTLVVTAEEDILTPPSDAKRLVDSIPNSHLVTLSGAHNLPIEHPNATSSCLLEFLGDGDQHD